MELLLFDPEEGGAPEGGVDGMGSSWVCEVCFVVCVFSVSKSVVEFLSG